MQTLVVGAGVAGLTLAAKLAQQGRPPVVVERSASPQRGYAIGLYPLGSCVLHGLGLYDQLLTTGRVIERYELADHRTPTMQTLDMTVLTRAIGPMVVASRATLIDVLTAGCRDVELRTGVAPSKLSRGDERVEVTFTDGKSEQFDLVVGCDGMNSTTRDLVFGAQPGFDSGWSLHTWWAPPGLFDPHVAKEWWGHGWFFGAYPASEAVMCAAGGPSVAAADVQGTDALRKLVGRLADRDVSVRGAIDAATDTYKWPMCDVRSKKWSEGRVALCGDAATSFMPTAGVGASNAMRAATALADELSRSDRTTIPLALELYEKRCRGVIERNQTESRRLARLMFLRHNGISWVRDQLARRYPAERMLTQIINSMRIPF